MTRTAQAHAYGGYGSSLSHIAEGIWIASAIVWLISTTALLLARVKPRPGSRLHGLVLVVQCYWMRYRQR